MSRKKGSPAPSLKSSYTVAREQAYEKGSNKAAPLILAALTAIAAVAAPALIPVLRQRASKYSTCNLGEVCIEGQERPQLQDGTTSRAVWDMPRYLMRNEFRGSLRHVQNPEASASFLSREPLIVFFDHVLSDAEIDYLITQATSKFERSRVMGEDGTFIDDPSRTSDTSWLPGREDEKIRQIKERVTRLVGFHGEYSEDISVNRYRKLPGEEGQQYRSHFDFLEENSLAASPAHSSGRCQRAATLLIYLTDVEAGGETAFFLDGENDPFDENNPKHIKVTPKRGRVLAWFDCHPHTEKVDHNTLHAGLPMIEGEKLAATFFVRNCTMYPEQVVRF